MFRVEFLGNLVAKKEGKKNITETPSYTPTPPKSIFSGRPQVAPGYTATSQYNTQKMGLKK